MAGQIAVAPFVIQSGVRRVIWIRVEAVGTDGGGAGRLEPVVWAVVALSISTVDG